MAAVAHLPAAPALRALALGLALAAAAAPVRAAPRREPGSVDKGLLKPGRAPVASYGPSAEKFCAGDASRKLQGEIGDVLKKVGKPAPSVDERLCALGDVLLGWDPAAGRPRPEVLAFASYSVGLVTPAQAVDVALLETEDAAQIADNVVQALASFSANANHARYALVTQRLGKGKTKVVLVLQDAAVEVDPLPRRLELNQSARLSGRIQAPFQDPKVYVASVRGELFAPEQAPGEAFQAEVACGDRPGHLLVEVRGTRDGASAPLASFPVACGTDLPASVAVAGERWPAALAEQTKRILAGVNAEREGAGLPALAWDDRVAEVAGKVAVALQDDSGGQPDLAALLKGAGLGSLDATESAAADRAVEGAHQRILRSPVNRANALNAHTTHAGVGIAQGEAAGKPLYFVVEVFVKELAPVDVAAEKEKLRAAIAERRQAAKLPPLADDPALERLAQRYADAYAAARGELTREQEQPVAGDLNRDFRKVSILKGAKGDALELSREPEVTEEGKSYGVGLVQADHPGLGKNALYTVLLLGTPREASPAAKAAPRAKAGKKK